MSTYRVPYRTSLRVLGRLLDGERARYVTLCEIDQGFLAHYGAAGDPRRVHTRAVHSAELLDLYDDIQAGRGKGAGAARKSGGGLFGRRGDDVERFKKSHPICPMGYETFLHALGDNLDRRNAQALLFTELDDYLHVEYTVDRADFVVRQGQRMALAGRRHERYNARQVVEMTQRSAEYVVERVRRSGQNLSYNPMDVPSYVQAGLALEDEGQYRDAEELFQMAVDLAPHHPEAHFHLARHARRRGNVKAALKSIDRALSLQHDESRYWHLRGRLCLESNQPKAAADALGRAVDSDPGNPIYTFHYSVASAKLGRAADAPPVFTRPNLPTETVADPVRPEADPARDDLPPLRSPGPADVMPALPAVQYPATDASEAPTPEPDRVKSRSLAARLGSYVETREEATAGTAARFEDGFSPFGQEDTLWEQPVPASAPRNLSESEVAMPTQTPRDGGTEALPASGLPLAGDWAAPLAATNGFSADSDPASAALPLLGLEGNAFAPSNAGETTDSTTQRPAGLTREAGAPGHDEAVQLAAAVLHAEEMVRAEPERADLHRKLGFLLAKQGRSEEAAAEFRRAVECGRRRLRR